MLRRFSLNVIHVFDSFTAAHNKSYFMAIFLPASCLHLLDAFSQMQANCRGIYPRRSLWDGNRNKSAAHFWQFLPDWQADGYSNITSAGVTYRGAFTWYLQDYNVLGTLGWTWGFRLIVTEWVSVQSPAFKKTLVISLDPHWWSFRRYLKPVTNQGSSSRLTLASNPQS